MQQQKNSSRKGKKKAPPRKAKNLSKNIIYELKIQY